MMNLFSMHSIAYRSIQSMCLLWLWVHVWNAIVHMCMYTVGTCMHVWSVHTNSDLLLYSCIYLAVVISLSVIHFCPLLSSLSLTPSLFSSFTHPVLPCIMLYMYNEVEGGEAKHHEAIYYIQSLLLEVYISTPVIQYVCHHSSCSLTSTKKNRCKTKGPCDFSENWVGHPILCTWTVYIYAERTSSTVMTSSIALSIPFNITW